MKTAQFIKDIEQDGPAKQKLYKVKPPAEYDEPWDEDDPPASKTSYVVVSAVIADYSGPETYIFPANKKGEVIDWGELEGSYRGGLSHSTALSNAGYEIIE